MGDPAVRPARGGGPALAAEGAAAAERPDPSLLSPRQGQAPLTLPQIQALLRQPPRFDQERQTIRELLAQLRRLGVPIELRAPRSPPAAVEWDPSRATLRVRPDVPEAGSLDFARVLNHEVIHVAQSCRGGGVRRPPVPVGLPRRLSRENAALINLPL